MHRAGFEFKSPFPQSADGVLAGTSQENLFPSEFADEASVAIVTDTEPLGAEISLDMLSPRVMVRE